MRASSPRLLNFRGLQHQGQAGARGVVHVGDKRELAQRVGFLRSQVQRATIFAASALIGQVRLPRGQNLSFDHCRLRTF
jgi:glutamine phosphoribosylpyrophosphate amidotransferase